jgi:hypothetical protein
MEILVLVIVLCMTWTVITGIACRACYHNGVTDGFGYSREPLNPGHRLAGEYLRKYLAHRWPELRQVPTDE